MQFVEIVLKNKALLLFSLIAFYFFTLLAIKNEVWKNGTQT